MWSIGRRLTRERDHPCSGTLMQEHWQAGLEEARRRIAQHDWLEMPTETGGATGHDVPWGDPA
ncbi:DUF3734 domain-containing protein [Fertoeibacter niger]|uniref:DUF3734 domain-containing protein n=1 Tax=Fertoeibacter niger TaxID=2656921 RepID=UPI0030B9FEB2